MPVNSFDNYPMSFKPNKEDITPPLYLSLAKELENQILSGKLKPNVLLPPQRELADFLDINLGTVTRAYKICQLKGLIYAVSGKGSFVSHRTQYLKVNECRHIFTKDDRCIELGIVKPLLSTDSFVVEAARKVINTNNSLQLFQYGTTYDSKYHIDTAKIWFEQLNLFPNSQQISFANGGQNALNVILTALFKAGDKIAVDEYTYPSFISLANLLNIQIVPIKTDNCGMIPEELNKTCKLNNIKGIYLMPSCNNPTAVMLAMGRRYKLAEIIKSNKIIIIEDEAYSFISPKELIPFISILPEQTIYIAGLSKALSPGLRVTYLMYSEKYRDKISKCIYDINLNTPLLNLEIVSELIMSEVFKKIINTKRKLLRKRNSIFRNYFEPYSEQSNSLSLFQCIVFNKKYENKICEIELRKQGIKVLDSSRFLVGNIGKEPFIRLLLCSPQTEDELIYALESIHGMLKE